MILLITITNWDLYNPRRDQKTHKWWRCDNSVFQDPDLWDLDSDGKIVWFGLCCEASRKGSSTISVSVPMLAALLRIEADKVKATIDLLTERGLISCAAESGQIRTDSAGFGRIRTDPCETRPDPGSTYERTNARTNGEAGTDPAGDEPKPPGPSKLVEVWNEERHPAFRACKGVKPSTDRWTSTVARLKEEPDLDVWRERIRRIHGWRHGQGHNDRSWVANFDWLVRGGTGLKIDEGTYDDRTSATTGAGSPTLQPRRSADVADLDAARAALRSRNGSGAADGTPDGKVAQNRCETPSTTDS